MAGGKALRARGTVCLSRPTQEQRGSLCQHLEPVDRPPSVSALTTGHT